MPLLNSVTTPYAEAFLQVVDDSNQTDEVVSQVREILSLMNDSPELEKNLDDLNYENTTNLFDFDINSACRYSFEKILNNELSIDENYKVFGKVVDFFDIRTVSSSGTGPQNITIEDKNGYRVTITVWDWEIATSNISTVLTKFNKNIY